MLQAGSYSRPLVFTGLRRFSRWGLKLMVRLLCCSRGGGDLHSPQPPAGAPCAPHARPLTSRVRAASCRPAPPVLQPGVRDADIQVAHLSQCGDGAVLQGGAAPIANTTLSHISVLQENQNSLVFECAAPPCAFRGVTARANFLLSGGWAAPEQPSAGVLFRGAPPQLERTQVVVQVGSRGALGSGWPAWRPRTRACTAATARSASFRLLAAPGSP